MFELSRLIALLVVGYVAAQTYDNSTSTSGPSMSTTTPVAVTTTTGAPSGPVCAPTAKVLNVTGEGTKNIILEETESEI